MRKSPTERITDLIASYFAMVIIVIASMLERKKERKILMRKSSTERITNLIASYFAMVIVSFYEHSIDVLVVAFLCANKRKQRKKELII